MDTITSVFRRIAVLGNDQAIPVYSYIVTIETVYGTDNISIDGDFKWYLFWIYIVSGGREWGSANTGRRLFTSGHGRKELRGRERRAREWGRTGMGVGLGARYMVP